MSTFSFNSPPDATCVDIEHTDATDVLISVQLGHPFAERWAPSKACVAGFAAMSTLAIWT